MVTLEGLLGLLVRYDQGALGGGFELKQASSYDRHRVSPDRAGWFANDDAGHFIREEVNQGRRERVMMEDSGPGAVVRIFTTNGGGDDNRVRVYLDGAAEPVLVWPKSDLLSGSLGVGAPLVLRHPAPEGHGGATFYLPIPYARGCKVTMEDLNPAGRASRLYYHVDYRRYPAGTAVESFSLAGLAKARRKIEEVNRALAHPPAPVSDGKVSVARSLAAGELVTLDLPKGANAVREFELSVGEDLSPAVREQALRSVVVRGSFDGEGETIWCPAGDFAGSGTGGRPMASWYRTVLGNGHSVCRWTMPYRSSGRLTLENLGGFPVKVRMVARTSRWAWDARSLYFHANWHSQAKIASRPDQDWNFLTVTGRGILMGDVMSVFNPLPSWYGEGDEKIWVDDERFPGILGTGTEDYYNASWAPNPVFQTPFSAQPRIDEPRSQGQNVYTRTRNLDGVPFTKSLKFDFEITTWQPSQVDYAATTYWYGAAGAKAHLGPQPEEARRPVEVLAPAFAIPGVTEIEGLPILATSPGLVTEVQDMRAFAGQWSSDHLLLLKSKKPGDFVEVAIPCKSSGPQRLTLYAGRANDYATLRFFVNGVRVPGDFNGYSGSVVASGAIPLGVFVPRGGRFVLRAEVVGCDPRCVGDRYLAGLDAVGVGG